MSERFLERHRGWRLQAPTLSSEAVGSSDTIFQHFPPSRTTCACFGPDQLQLPSKIPKSHIYSDERAQLIILAIKRESIAQGVVIV